MADIPIAAHVAHECGAFHPLVPPADDRVVVHVSETAALGAVSRAVDLTPAPKAEIDRAAGGIVAEHRRSGAAVDVDAAVGMWVGEIGAGEAVWLCHRKSVLEHHDIADSESIACVGAADGDANVARTVPLLEGDTGTFLQQVLDREGR